MTAPHPAQGDEPRAGFTPPALLNLVYCSRATAAVDATAVDRIIATARRHNPEYGITGMRVFSGGIFFQWLEGPRDNVLALMARLKADTRHEDVIQLSVVEEVRERLFPDWDMELVSAEHISEVLLDAQSSATDPQNAQGLGRLLTELETGALSALKA